MLSVVGVVVAITALVPVWLFGPAPLYAGGKPADAVPGKLHLPWMWQATVEQDPRGPASVLFTGSGLGLSGSDLIDHEGKVAVVGRDGSYRMMLYGGSEVTPGDDVLLSPNGTFVAQGFKAGAEKDGWVVVTDLGTGKSRAFRGVNGATCCGRPVAWAPDGKSLLAIDFNQEPTHFDPVTGTGVQPARLWLLDLTTGGTRQIVGDLGDLNKLRSASLAAFSPDGKRIAVTVGDELRMIDVTGRTLWTSTLEPGRYLAGTAAFTPDDTKIVTVAVEGCRTDCDAPALAARQWHVGYLDARTGTNADGPPIDPVTGMAVRAVGWRHGTDLAAVVYQPDRRLSKEMLAGTTGTGLTETGHVTLVALRQSHAPEVLLDPPNEVLALDVAQDLLRSGRVRRTRTRTDNVSRPPAHPPPDHAGGHPDPRYRDPGRLAVTIAPPTDTNRAGFPHRRGGRRFAMMFASRDYADTTISVASLSEQGPHPNNEDAFLIARHPADTDIVLCLLADGQGGHAGGARAAQVACQTALDAASGVAPRRLRAERSWRRICRAADMAVAADADAGLTTLIAFGIADGRVVGASNGDSAAVAISNATPLIELTQHQAKNPPVGSGNAEIVGFTASLATPWSVVTMSDGVWRSHGRDHVFDRVLELRGTTLIASLLQQSLLCGDGSVDDDFTVVTIDGTAPPEAR